MTKRIPLQTIFFLIILIFSAILPAFSQEEKPILAIMEFESSGIQEEEMDIYMEIVSSYLVDTGKYRVIDRAQRDLMLEEMKFSNSGLSDQKAQIEAGKLLSAEYLLVGSVGILNKKYFLSMKILITDTSETLKSITESYRNFDKLINNTEEAVFGLTDAGPVSDRNERSGSGGSLEIGGWFANITGSLSGFEFDESLIDDSDGTLYDNENIDQFEDLYNDQFIPSIGLSAGYTYQLSERFGLGFYGGVFWSTFPSPEVLTYTSPNWHWNGKWQNNSALYPFIGPKIIFGDVEKLAASAMMAFGLPIGDESPQSVIIGMPSIGVYYKRYHLNFNFLIGNDEEYWDGSVFFQKSFTGIGFEFGYSFPISTVSKLMFKE